MVPYHPDHAAAARPSPVRRISKAETPTAIRHRISHPVRHTASPHCQLWDDGSLWGGVLFLLQCRPLSEMILIYHNSVGMNTVLELDFAIDRSGRLDPSHSARYKQLGDWIRTCYGKSIAAGAVTASSKPVDGVYAVDIVARPVPFSPFLIPNRAPHGFTPRS